MIDLHQGRWQDHLDKIGEVQAVITDPPYGARTHQGHEDGAKQRRQITGQESSRVLGYASLDEAGVQEIVRTLGPHNTGWWAVQTSHDLIPAWESEFWGLGLYCFSPVPVHQFRPRLLGDGPSSFGQYLVVARPRNAKYGQGWGCLDASYEAPVVRNAGIVGAKPVSLMQQIVRDYSRPGDVVLDPFAGVGSTLIAAQSLARSSIGFEVDSATYEICRENCEKPVVAARHAHLTNLGIRKLQRLTDRISHLDPHRSSKEERLIELLDQQIDDLESGRPTKKSKE
jgi:site-specific DNA-methyltransferase (adenine-specific)